MVNKQNGWSLTPANYSGENYRRAGLCDWQAPMTPFPALLSPNTKFSSTMSIISLPCELDEYLYFQLNNPDLYHLSWTCQEAYQHVTSFLNHAFCFHEYLAKYFSLEKTCTRFSECKREPIVSSLVMLYSTS